MKIRILFVVSLITLVVVGYYATSPDSFQSYEVNLSSIPECPDGYEIASHTGSGKLRILVTPVYRRIDIKSDQPEWQGRDTPQFSVMEYYADPVRKHRVANANVFNLLVRNQSLIPAWLKSREDTTLRGRPATQARFFYFLGTVFRKKGGNEKGEEVLAVPYIYWDRDDEVWQTGYQEVGPTRRAGWGRMRMVYNTFDKNDYTVVLD